MLRMSGFEVRLARSAEEAVARYHDDPQGSQYIAGGTDLLPNLKHRILAPRQLVALTGALPKGWQVEEQDSGEVVVIGAGTTLSALARCAELPPLASAASLVAGPQIRNMGTIGGNVLLDTRCLFYNQTAFWRKSLGYCLKAEGDWCHVIGGPKTCVATQSSDTVPVLLAMNASIRLLGPEGARRLNLRELFRFDGKDHLKIAAGELLTHVEVPRPGAGFRGSYHKIRARGAIDFPMLGVAVAADFDGTGPDAPLTALEVVIGAVNPAPKALRGAEALLGRPLDDAGLALVAELVHKQTRPQGSVQGDVVWRRQLAAITTRRALQQLRAG